MRMMMKATIGLEAGNRAVKNGTIGKTMATMMERLKPEAAYFTTMDQRTAMFFFDLSDTSQLPSIVESIFQDLEADVVFVPVMNADDLKKGLASIAPK